LAISLSYITPGCTAIGKVANRNVRDFGWEIAHEAVSLDMVLARAEGYTHATKVWDLSIVPKAIFCRPVPNLSVAIRDVCVAERRPPRVEGSSTPAAFPRRSRAGLRVLTAVPVASAGTPFLEVSRGGRTLVHVEAHAASG
jgi:hypothetical protein